jgi:radical SAM protein with 4Fe4S-binding SPASM domain
LTELCEKAKELKMNTTVLSNTHIYPKGQIDRVSELIDCFETTIHGPTPEAHDLIALKNGALKTVLRNLKKICENKKTKSIGIIYNVTPQNCRQLFETVENLRDKHGIPIDHLVLQRVIPQGRARTTSKFTIGCSHAIAVLEEIEKVMAKYQVNTFFEDPFPFCVVPEKFHKYLNKCEWGFTRAAIDNQGSLSRCGADPRYRLGNVLETPLLELWNTNPILLSFRSRQYLPKECLQCKLLEKCRGGCALSCEIERDHGHDYLYYERTKVTIPTGTSFTFRCARHENLSDILRIEWANFPDYEFKFTPNSVLKWYAQNPEMFYVFEDSTGHVIGYATLVPLTEGGFLKIKSGKACSLQELSPVDVHKTSKKNNGYWHIEVIATIADARSRVGRTLIKKVGEFLIGKANIITASPITYMGAKLCSYFNFEKIATEKTKRSVYDIYILRVDQGKLKKMLERF